MTPIVVTITGPSSAGKTVLSQALAQQGFEPLVSTTTRHPRAGEVNGRDYHFVSKDEFRAMLANGELIENVEYDGNYYGVAAKEAVRAFEKGKPAVLVAEPHGCKQIYDLCSERGWQVFRVFVNNPIPVLIDRMLKRFYEDVSKLDPQSATFQTDLQKKVDSHGGRIQKILGQEQEEWVKPALSGQVRYDLIIPRFDGNQEAVVAQVKATIAADPSADAQRKPPKL